MKKIFDLCSDELMAICELMEDPIFRKIPKDKIKYYIENSFIIGCEKAAMLKKNCGNKTLTELCMDNGITVNIIDKPYKVMDTNYRAEIIYSENQINILKPSIMLMEEQLKDIADIEKIIDIHIAHEFYHFLEYRSKKDTADMLSPVTILKIGKFNKKSKVIKTCEIAAHAFCKEYLNLPFHPKALDFIFLINKGEMSYDEFVQYLEYVTNILNV